MTSYSFATLVVHLLLLVQQLINQKKIPTQVSVRANDEKHI